MRDILVMRSHLCGCRGQALLYLLLCAAFAPGAFAKKIPSPIPQVKIERSVMASLPASHGRSADILRFLDLTRPFKTRTRWTFLVATLPGFHLGGASAGPVKGGALAECFVNELSAHCKYSTPRSTTSLSWFSTPVHFYSAKVVFAGADRTEPLLLVKAGSAYGGDGGHAIFTQLFAYERPSNRFRSVFSNTTGSNNNQETRFVARGPLRGDVIEAVPTSTAPYAYWISVYARDSHGNFSDLAIRFRSATRYGDGNRLAVIDSDMANILEHLGKWKPGDPLPIPRHSPSGCAGHLALRRGEEWCPQ